MCMARSRDASRARGDQSAIGDQLLSWALPVGVQSKIMSRGPSWYLDLDDGTRVVGVARASIVDLGRFDGLHRDRSRKLACYQIADY